ncbi:MAG: MogA/MoaB family molybdenum cofactor biosynthesis protein [Candidatus Krumholzibacteriota bacterium]|nr:MogA/MoaB family molybdenum cofactor biosynthesis protein [Candidatus Krumholzibacteriota bacterium]
MKVKVLTISDRASAGIYEDRSGPAVAEILRETWPEIDLELEIVTDDGGDIEKALGGNLDRDVIITTGGTGIGPRDNTPGVTEAFCDRMIPGIAEYLRRESCRETVNAVLSRGVSGIRGRTLIVNLPGSVKGAQYCARLLVPLLPHALRMIRGEGH